MPSIRSRLRCYLEQFEPRLLLAADLGVAIDEYASASPDDTVTRVIRVYNNGDRDAEDALITSKLSAELNEPTWSRSTGYAQLTQQSPYRDADAEVLLGRSTDFVELGGDVNGDGIEDFAITRFVRSTHFTALVFGGHPELSVNIRGDGSVSAVAAGLDTADANRFWVRPLLQSPTEPIWELMGQNADGSHDVAVNGFLIEGGAYLNEVDDLPLQDHLGPSYGILGDVDNDGNDDHYFGVGPTFLLLGEGSERRRVEVLPSATNPCNDLICPPNVSAKIQALGDISGDGIDDFAVDETIVCGRDAFQDLDDQSEIDLNQLAVDAHFTMEDTEFQTFGDLNGDGIGDLAVTNIDNGPTSIDIYWGGDDLVANGQLNPESFGYRFPLLPLIDGIGNTPVPVGDINNDSFVDFSLGPTWKNLEDGELHFQVALGGPPANFPEGTNRVISIALPEKADFFESPIVIGIPVGDVNDDGVDDLLIEMHAGYCFCTASDAEGIRVVTGATVILGDANLGANLDGELGSKSAIREESPLMKTFLFEGPITTPQAATYLASDENLDGVPDLDLGHVVVHGGSQMESIDFTEVDTMAGAFNGDNGFARSANNWTSSIRDLNGDTQDDRLVFEDLQDKSIQYSFGLNETTDPVAGQGNLNDIVTIPAGQSVIYTVVGRLRDDAGALAVEAEVAGESDLTRSDNRFPRTSGLEGDLNSDDVVDFKDFLILSTNFARTNASLEEGDITGDAIVDFSDFVILSQQFGTRG